MPCSSFLCQNVGSGSKICSGCIGAEPPTVYCNVKCQKDEWKFHKKYCGKDAYTFRVTLIGSKNPVISRAMDVPSFFTFQQFHFAIEYGFAWNNTHLHEFHFSVRGENDPTGMISFARTDTALKISSPNPDEFTMPGMPPLPPVIDHTTVRLADFFDEKGSKRSLVMRNGAMLPLFYMYDFGDHWEHKVEFLGRNLARAARPLYVSAEGCAPIENSGGVKGWEEVKAAFAAPHPSRNQRDRIACAKRASGQGDGYWINDAPDLVPYNYEGRWENHEREFKQMERSLNSY